MFWVGILGQISAQKLVENKIDEFTENSIKRTSWERFVQTALFTSNFRISKIDDNLFFELKMMDGSVFSIDKDQKLMFKLEDNEIVKLPNLEFKVTCEGCGAKGFAGSLAQGIQVAYLINLEQIEKLKNNNAEKIRIYTNDGYREYEMKSKNYAKVKKALSLIE